MRQENIEETRERNKGIKEIIKKCSLYICFMDRE